MAVYFVYRCDDVGPSDLHRRRFDDFTVLEWFRRVWRPIHDVNEAHAYADQLLGVQFGLGSIFVDAADADTPPPRSMEDVRNAFDSSIVPTALVHEEHCLQVLNDNDEPDSVVYFFDDAFVAKHPHLTAYLLHGGPLPDGAGEPGWAPSDPAIREHSPWQRVAGEGRIYAFARVHQTYGEFYGELGVGDVVTFDGLRLPQFCRWLMRYDADDWGHAWGELNVALAANDLGEDDQERAFLAALREQPDDEVSWRAYADWLMERDGPSPGARLLRLALRRQNGLYDPDPGRNVVRVGEHVAEAFVASGKGCDHLFFFDDLWGAAHPVLADALLRYATRWDVLTTDDARTD